MNNLGVFGGTFDPPHIGHLILARYAYVELNLNKILFVPARNQPHKKEKNIASPEARLEMLKLAIRDDNRFEVSSMEIERKGLSYTYQTLKGLKKLYPESELYFIIGGDNIVDIETWKNPEEIFNLATVAAAMRPEYVLKGKYKNRIKIFNMPQIDISSTMIRNMIRGGQTVKHLVPSSVEKYIKHNRLYL